VGSRSHSPASSAGGHCCERSSIKCRREDCGNLNLGVLVLTSPAGHLHPPCRPPATQGSLVHLRRCISAGMIAVPPLIAAALRSRQNKIEKVAGIMRCASRPRRPSQLWGCRLTKRCSDPGRIKCLAAGEDLPTSSPMPRARVLTGQRAVAELGR
jgi:hypothetical protein